MYEVHPDANDYVDIDADAATGEELTECEIVQMCSSQQTHNVNDNESASDEDPPSPVKSSKAKLMCR